MSRDQRYSETFDLSSPSVFQHTVVRPLVLKVHRVHCYVAIKHIYSNKNMKHFGNIGKMTKRVSFGDGTSGNNDQPLQLGDGRLLYCLLGLLLPSMGQT